MATHILLPTDGSELTPRAIEAAIAQAKAFQAPVSVIAVKEPFPYSAISEMQPIPPQAYEDAQQRIAETRVKAAMDTVREAGVACDGFTVEAIHPWEAILDHAKTHGCDLIVMASHGRRGISGLLLGSETVRVLTHSPVAVLVVK